MNMNNESRAGSVEKGPWSSLKVELGASSHTGHIRENNEDSYLVMRFGRSLENLLTNLEEDLLEENYAMKGYGMLVADGMGGASGGEVASRFALSKLVELIVDTSDWTLALQRRDDVETVLRWMTERFLHIDYFLRNEAAMDQTLRGMGTTLTMAGVMGNDLIIGHVGDSRAYLLRDADLKQLTTDHTLAQALIDAGVAGRDDPASRSMRHVLTAAVGSLGEKGVPQVQLFKLSDDDQLLLCTDGLTETVEDATIAEVLRETKSAQFACNELVNLALAGGGSDNITVIVARFISLDGE